MSDVLSKIRQLTNQIQLHEDQYSLDIDQIIQNVSNLIVSNVYLVDQTGFVIDMCVQETNQLDPLTHCELGDRIATDMYQTLQANEIVANINMYDDSTNKIKTLFPERYTTVIPILSKNIRLGTLLIYGARLTEEDLILVEYSSLLLGLELRKKQAKEVQQHKMIKQAINSLTYREIKAVGHVISELKEKEMEGVVIVKRISEANSLNPSTFVNALRKLQSAGIVHLKSQGPKGTYVKVLNQQLLTAIKSAHV